MEIDFGNVLQYVGDPAIWGGPLGGVAGYLLRRHIDNADKARKAKDQIAKTVVGVQARLAAISFDGLGTDIKWSVDKPQWAKLSIFEGIDKRLEDAIRVCENGALSPVIRRRIEKYRESISVFAERWYHTKARNRDGFWKDYNSTKKDMHNVLESIEHLGDFKEAILEGVETDDSEFAPDINQSHGPDGKPSPNTFGYGATSNSAPSSLGPMIVRLR
ncbi:hypothetical protein [Parvularcula sp. LCG005]|uniref:hypothetical protein n=1 Tax=Parvularcula sp. LCG005 TaxID=3078805 RepID=UPI0029426BF1|nr:hypothetical protein [Parvularcula sp. LCG005]WOI52580.1 hypothetical protein RUI03_10520 [Parvularcula sp. LCG005]